MSAVLRNQSQAAGMTGVKVGNSIGKSIAITTVLGLCGLAALQVYQWTTRYYIIQSSDGRIHEMDRQTGRTWIINGTTKTEIKQKRPATAIPSTIAPQIKVQKRYNFPNSRPTVDVYNGTNWTVTGFDFKCFLEDGFLAEGKSRIIRVNYQVEPYRTGSVYVDSGENKISKVNAQEVFGVPPEDGSP